MNKTLKKVLLGFTGVAIVAIVGFSYVQKNKQPKLETFVVKKGEFVDQVSATGKVVAAEAVDLGFEVNGRITRVPVSVGGSVVSGQILSSLDSAEIVASLEQRQAALAEAQAKLAALMRGTRPEQIAVSASNVTGAEIALGRAKQSMVDTLRTAYTDSDDALKNKADQLFLQPQSNNPRLNITIADQQLQISIESKRVRIGLSLREWLQANQNLMLEKDILSVVKDVKKHLASLNDFFYDASIAVNGLTLSTNPQLSQSTIDKYKSDIAAARATINTVLSSITAAETSEQTAETALATAQRQLALDQAGATVEDIAAENAQVKSAEADVANIQAKIGSYIIRAPFSGIITRVDAKVGQVASAGQTQVSLISGGMYEIESYVPEVHIANIVVGNDVNVTLDAYGENTKFSAIVTAIDPAETVKDGVSTYKVTLQFKEKDERIKPGMTANVQIVTMKKNDSIVIPQGLIKTEKGISQVSLLQNGQVVSQIVETGGTTALGQVEVISGLQDGDVIVADPIKK